LKLLLWIVAAASLVGLSSRASKSSNEILIVSGDTHGYLQPCGCTKPMQGGILRRATAIRALSKPNATVFVDNGGLIEGVQRQDVLKAETLAEAMGTWNVNAVNLTFSESRLGRGQVGVLQDLLGNKLVCSSLRPSETNRIPATVEAGSYVIGALCPQTAQIAANLEETDQGIDAGCQSILDQASKRKKKALLLWGGDLESAQELIKGHPGFDVVVYGRQGTPPKDPPRMGKTVFLTPGERGKHLIRAEFDGAKLKQAQVIELGPDFNDDADAAKIYVNYQDRVGDEKLLELLPRADSDTFVGSEACRRCHTKAYDTWKESGHAHALKTLENKNSSRDPDCVSCHVVGLGFKSGFQSRKLTPQLTDVGCESCHGPGKSHSESQKPLGPAVECTSCHNLEHDPRFDRNLAWEKVRH